MLRELEEAEEKGEGAEGSRGAEGDRGVAGELVIVSTAGDLDQASSLAEIGGKGVFVKEVQAAVLSGEADAAVHSAKDLPAQTPEGLTIGAVLKRGDPRDALVGCGLADLPLGATIATGAPRRRAQLAALRPDLRFAELRGNIATRLAKAGDYDAIVVAVAALERLGFAEVDGGNLNLDIEVEGIGIANVLDAETFIPQVGQGTIAVECRSDDEAMKQMLASIDHSPTRICLEAERGFLQALGGDCNLPAGAHAVLSDGPTNDEAASDATLEISAFLATTDRTSARDTASLSLDLTAPLNISVQTASTTGQNLARSLLAKVRRLQRS